MSLGLGCYILGGPDGQTPIHEPDYATWALWMADAERSIAMTGNDDRRVSTIFLGFDHNFFGRSKPVLFETMVFGGAYDREMERYCTWEEAEAGHKHYCALVFGEAFAET